MTDATRMPRALRPFSSGQYRLLVAALAASLLSAGAWLVAAVWQVVELGGSPIDLSYVAVGSSLGLVLAVLVGGVAADRIPQRRILFAVEIVRGLAFAVAAVLAATGVIEVWHIALLSFVLGLADGFFYPAYSAWLPAILPAGQLLAANGIEGVLRPAVMQAAGPALASALIAVQAPWLAFAVVAGLQAVAAVVLAVMRTTPVRRDPDEVVAHPLRQSFIDLRDGFAYLLRTRWLFATLVFSIILVFLIMGPIEVLLPFAVKDQTGGGAGAFALALGAFGLGGAVGSLTVASLRIPRRYLTLMILAWGVGCVPLAIIGLTSWLWVMVVALFIVGVLFDGAQVVWGTLLQRRVPPSMLGRVSSLDFFVSLALMPISMAVAGPVGETIGLAPAFLIAGLVPPFLAFATLAIARLGEDELAHPLDGLADATTVTGAEVAAGFEPPADEEHPRADLRPRVDPEPG
ncbi:putative MFS family arabinose efflux permease [Agromyces ramosus]|uniref:Putative MFS family arabinose efflux permease n=1 Tax=Agromyces ramosus TaxID=33879 RepID=A0A4Q7ME06_9MICO|nr:MFS transporter [Agromyces ramosus]RZS65707.1 putative MFS family arabinose efflux permease [Agromyces ramosus]